MTAGKDVSSKPGRDDRGLRYDGQIRTLLAEVERVVDELTNKCRALESQLVDARSELSQTKLLYEKAVEERNRKEAAARDWERRCKTAEARADQTERKAGRDSIAKLGARQILSDVDLLTRAERIALSQTGDHAHGRSTASALQSAILQWASSICDAKIERIFDTEEIEVHVEDSKNLCEFEPKNPFTDMVKSAKCRVLSSGWRTTDGLIVEKARLAVLASDPDKPDFESHGVDGRVAFDLEAEAFGLKEIIPVSKEAAASNPVLQNVEEPSSPITNDRVAVPSTDEIERAVDVLIGYLESHLAPEQVSGKKYRLITQFFRHCVGASVTELENGIRCGLNEARKDHQRSGKSPYLEALEMSGISAGVRAHIRTLWDHEADKCVRKN